MSLLLDALKEADARKRGTAAMPAVEPSFETDGNLALAEDVAPEVEPRVEAIAAPQRREPASASTRSPAAPATAPAVDAASRDFNLLPWLVGAVGFLLLLLGGFALFEALTNRTGAAPVEVAEPASSLEIIRDTTAGGTNGEITLQPQVTSATSAPRVSSTAAAAVRRPRPAPAAAAAPPAASAERLSISREPAPLAAAWGALQRGDVEQAEQLYRRVLDGEPGQVDAELGLAVIAHARADDEIARRGYRRVLESVPDHPRAWAGLAELVGDGELGQIESRLRQLLADRASAPLHFALGNVLARQQRWDDAQLEYFAAASLDSRSADYAFNVAVALERIGKAGAALPWYRRAVALASAGRAARFDPDVIRDRISTLETVQP